MKTNRMLALLVGLAVIAALQTGCIFTDYLPAGTKVSKHVVDCVNFDRQGTTDAVVALAGDRLWYTRPVGSPPTVDPNGPVSTKITPGDAAAWFTYLGGTTTYGYLSYTYGVGSGEHAFAPWAGGEQAILRQHYFIAPNIKWPCSASAANSFSEGIGPWYFQIVPESANYSNTPALAGNTAANLAGAIPSMVMIDQAPVSGGCQFWNNIVAKNPGIWSTPGLCDPDGPGGPLPGGPCSAILEPGASTWEVAALGVCFTGLDEYASYLTSLPVQVQGEDCNYQIGRPYTLSLKSGEASAVVLPTLNEETGRVRVTLSQATIRGKVFTPKTAPYIEVVNGRGIVWNPKQAGVKEMAKWALENVDLSKPFHTSGERLPFLKGNGLPNAQVMVDMRGLAAAGN